MCSVVAVDVSTLPLALHEACDLRRRLHDRGGGQHEVWFAFADPDAVLPVLDGGVVKLARWGSKDRGGRLPIGGWTWRQSVEEGKWSALGCETEPVRILADFGHELGVWYPVTEGIHGVLVRPPGDAPPVVYMVCEPATRYYRVMTKSDRMPSLVNEVI